MRKLLRPLANLHHAYHTRLLARNVIRLCEEIKLQPQLLIDCGAHNSEFARPLQKHWPLMRIESFEPFPSDATMGTVHNVVLGKEAGVCDFNRAGAQSYVTKGIGNRTVQTLDSFYHEEKQFPHKVILKVDCETSTADVLTGAHETIDNCSMLVVEVWNHPKLTPNFTDQSTNIMAMAVISGFTHSRVVDVSTMFCEVWTYDIAFWK